MTVDATPPDAGLDATPGVACASGGAASVSVDLGDGSAATAYQAAWWNTGHVTKACFQIAVMLSTTTEVPDPYFGHAGLLEAWFTTPPALGDNAVSLHLYQPDAYVPATVTLTTLSDTEVAGSIDGGDGTLQVTGAFTAARCVAIYDPCI
ncbi:MAG: hypothetical protein H6709_12260 [Kofleriaceae bacterium]|nr:hypothetical protein [Kofleriaceae bacterium]